MTWPLIDLPDICRPKQWPTIPKTKMLESGYPVFGANGIIGFFSEYNHEEPTILITCRGATCGSINVCEPKSYVTGNAMALDDLDTSRADLRFVTRILEGADFSGVITGVAQPQITRQSLSRLQIPLPPLAEQKRIATILDAADALRAKRRESLAQLDTLLQSIFLDMFGDPVTNPKGWEERRFGTISGNSFRNGLSPSTKGSHDGEVLTLSAITSGKFVFAARKQARFDKEPSPHQLLSTDTFLICRGNGNKALVGVGIFPDRASNSVCFPDTMIGATIDNNSVMPAYLQHVWNSHRVRTQIERGARTTNGTYKVNQQLLKLIEIPLPPIDLQHRFATIVESVEQQKTRLRAHLTELDTLFASLQQRAFNGDL